MKLGILRTLAAIALALTSTLSTAQSVRDFKIGFILPLTGPFQPPVGRQVEAGARLWMSLNGDSVAGRKVRLVIRDDAATADVSRRVAQEMIVNDKVDILAGFALTPSALAVAPLATQSKTPQIVMSAAASSITEASPYVVRTSFALPQAAVTLADWAPRSGIKTVVSLVSDYGPGIDAEKFFKMKFTQNGGKVLDELRVPLRNPDFAPFLQKVRDIKPDAVFVFLPSGAGVAFVKQFVERGLDKAGVKLIATGDLTDDDQLNSMTDAALGLVTAYHYSTIHESAANKRFVSEFMKANKGLRPNAMAVHGYDGMRLVYEALAKTGGKGGGDALVAAMKGRTFESPRGQVTIDSQTRDINQDVYLRKVEKRDGQLYNVEFDVVKQVKDPGKAR